MRIHVVDSITFYTGPRVRSIQATLFHGVATRAGKPAWWARSPKPGDLNPPSLSLTRTRHFFPKVTMPSGNIVVTSDIAARLPASGVMEPLAVSVEKLVDCFYEKGDFSLFSGPEAPSDTDDYLVSLPASRAPCIIPQFVELLTFHNVQLVEAFPSARKVTIHGGPQSHNAVHDVALTSEMFQQYPIQDSRAGHLMTDDVFEVLGEHLDPDFFHVTSIEID